jgi:hypothetical protein
VPGHSTTQCSPRSPVWCAKGFPRSEPRLPTRLYPRSAGSAAAQPAGDGTLSGITSWYSIRTLPTENPVYLAEFHRALKPGGYLPLAFFESESGPRRFTRPCGHAYRWHRQPRGNGRRLSAYERCVAWCGNPRWRVGTVVSANGRVAWLTDHVGPGTGPAMRTSSRRNLMSDTGVRPRNPCGNRG